MESKLQGNICCYDLIRKTRFAKHDFNGLYVRVSSLNKFPIPLYLKFMFSDEFLRYYAVAKLWSKNVKHDKFRYVSSLRVDKFSNIARYYGDLRNEDDGSKSLIYIEFMSRNRFLLFYFDKHYPKADNMWIHINSLLEKEGVVRNRNKVIELANKEGV